jgi:hypothetical protein
MGHFKKVRSIAIGGVPIKNTSMEVPDSGAALNNMGIIPAPPALVQAPPAVVEAAWVVRARDVMRKVAEMPMLSEYKRIGIAKRLSDHFDETLGHYLDGYSDEAIALEVDVPRIYVEHLRYTNCGPIKLTPEIKALRQAIEAYAPGVEQAIATAKAAEELAAEAHRGGCEVRAAYMELLTRLEALEGQGG